MNKHRADSVYQLHNLLGSTKICKFNASFIIDEDVCPLNVGQKYMSSPKKERRNKRENK